MLNPGERGLAMLGAANNALTASKVSIWWSAKYLSSSPYHKSA
jgi:hypothetical protein